MILRTVLLVITLYSCNLSCTAKRRCPRGLIFNRCSSGCSPQCGFWNKPDTCMPCVKTCECKNGKYESWDKNLNVKCVKRPSKCRCPKGQVYNENSNACTATCEQPYPKPGCQEIKLARCQCPSNKPILYKGKCIKFDQCVCEPGKKESTGCNQCNQCFCKNGRIEGCTEIGCPETSREEDARNLARGGCYMKSPRGLCIFYNPCPEKFEANCDSFPDGVCGCKCKCTKNGMRCGQTSQECEDDMTQKIMKGAGTWRELKDGGCTFMLPAPELDASSCKDADPGTTTCDECNTCECVNGFKFCTKNICKLQSRCPVRKLRCTEVSPCPKDEPQCPVKQEVIPIGDPRNFLFMKNFCYVFNEKNGLCEMHSPCPQKCTEGETLCNKCNECTCKNGKIRCSNATCGDPTRQGCWTSESGSCLYTSPCPWDSYLYQCSPKKKNVKTKDILRGGCWLPRHGTCAFYFPCPVN